MLTMAQQEELAGMLGTWDNGDEQDRGSLMTMVIEELRIIARHHLRKERAHHTLRTDGLVNEVYLRLHSSKNLVFNDKVHFFGIASNAMRQVLVDYAREQATEKRGGKRDRVYIENLDHIVCEEDLDLLQLNEAIEDLAIVDERKAKIVVMRYFGGLTLDEVASVMDTSVATIKREWKTAKARLMVRMNGRPGRSVS